MHFTRIQLKRFRNYEALDLRPHPGITVLYGPNGSGKTNLLEAMHLLPEPSMPSSTATRTARTARMIWRCASMPAKSPISAYSFTASPPSASAT